MNSKKNSGSPEGNLLIYLKSKMQAELTEAFNTNITPMLKGRTLNQLWTFSQPGDISGTAVWIDRGYGRVYKISPDMEGLPFEHTIDFFKPKRIMLDPAGFFNGIPGDCYMEIARDAAIVPFTSDNFKLLKLSAPEAATLANNILADDKADGYEKMLMLKMKPRARYKEFIRIFGVEIHQHFDAKDIASYLNMTPPFLSRLRGER
jgi:hypothetical protein